MIRDVTDLRVYLDSLALIPKLYDLTRKLPASEIDLVRQARRAGKSIPANICEGFGKRFYEKEFKRYLLNSLGSSDEVLTHLRTIILLFPELKIETESLLQEYKSLSKQINVLYKTWHFGASL